MFVCIGFFDIILNILFMIDIGKNHHNYKSDGISSMYLVCYVMLSLPLIMDPFNNAKMHSTTTTLLQTMYIVEKYVDWNSDVYRIYIVHS